MDLSNIPKILKNSTIIKKYPASRDKLINGCWKWIEGRTKDDKAKNLWRIHDHLYDLSDFIQHHPGGSYWLEITKGTDITEAFESHHISDKPSMLLDRFYVEDATDERNYFLKFDDNGFYMTLKRRIAKKLETADWNVTKKSKLIHDINLIVLFLSIIFLARISQFEFMVFFNTIAALTLAWSVSLSHNFMHQRDNWRRFTMNFSSLSWRGKRVTHVLSHHMYPNSYADYEMAAYEPYYRWVGSYKKPIAYVIKAIITSPLVLSLFFHNSQRHRLSGLIFANHKIFYLDELMFLVIPTIMTIFGVEPISWDSFCDAFWRMNYFFIPAELIYTLIFLNRGQHGNDRIHQNDQIKSFDFGEYQLSTSRDRSDVSHNLFLSMAFYGNEVFHHLFPTIDQAMFPQLKCVLIETCKDFNIKLDEEITTAKSYVNQIKQLLTNEMKALKKIE